ncbi:MAG: hypothetical protein ACRD2O_13155 [Terriglobia bacterium]
MAEDEDKGQELLRQLIQATEEGRVVWRPTAKLNEFVSSLKGRFGIFIGEGVDSECYLRMEDEDGREMLSLSDANAPVLSGPVGKALLGVIGPVRRLFEIARRQAMHVDQAIDEILQDLKQA